jgi:ATPase family associated with various cellular activities (AAA)
MDDQSEAILQQILTNAASDDGGFDGPATQTGPPVDAASLMHAPVDKAGPGKSLEAHSQWAIGPNGKYMPIGSTAQTLPAGVYETFAIPGMWGVEKLEMNSDGIYILPDMATQIVLDEAKKFWESEARYRKHKLLYKRGILLFGPPGGGKTVAVKLLIEELVKQNGIVLLVSSVTLANACLKAIRRIEPNRNLIVVLEDIDEIMNYNGEATLLSMLDGESNVDNILHVATTNYPERLGPRIINRPSRFDRRVHVGMPTTESRRDYLRQATSSALTAEQLDLWAKDSDGLSIAHLRELVAAVYCLEQPYGEVIERLQEMAKMVKSDPDFKKTAMGFNKGKTASSDFYAPD